MNINKIQQYLYHIKHDENIEQPEKDLISIIGKERYDQIIYYIDDDYVYYDNSLINIKTLLNPKIFYGVNEQLIYNPLIFFVYYQNLISRNQYLYVLYNVIGVSKYVIDNTLLVNTSELLHNLINKIDINDINEYITNQITDIIG